MTKFLDIVEKIFEIVIAIVAVIFTVGVFWMGWIGFHDTLTGVCK